MAGTPLLLRYAARSHVGMVRAKNDDSAYAGHFLAVVADGMGGHAGGDVASASTVLDLIHLDHNRHGDDAGTNLADEIQSANSLLSELVHVNPKLAGMGTTVTALLLSGERLAYAHIGDSRAYRLKDGVFEQISTDHTFVQRMIDEGRMTEAEAEVHPHKNVLMRVLGDVDASPELDLQYFDATAGERWLLCSDGLNFVRHEMIEEVIRNTKSLATAADTLIDLTLAAGSPDNVTVVVFDIEEGVVDDAPTASLEAIVTPAALPVGEPAADSENEANDDGQSALDAAPVAAVPAEGDDASDGAETPAIEGAEAPAGEGAATESPMGALDVNIQEAVVLRQLASREHELVGAALTANAEGKIPHLARRPVAPRAAMVLTHKPDTSPTIVEDAEVSLPRLRYRPLVVAIVAVLTTLAVVAGAWAAYAWTQTQFFVGAASGNVAIYQGVSQSLGPIPLSHLYRETGVAVESLPEYSQQLVAKTVPAATLGDAEQIIVDLQLGTGTSLPPCDLVSPPTTAATAKPTASGAAKSTGTAPATPTAAATHAPTGSVAANPAESTAGTTATSSSTATAKPSPMPTPTCIPGGAK